MRCVTKQISSPKGNCVLSITLDGFDINNPYKYTDPDGHKVVLAVRPARGPLGVIGAHAYYQITPDNPGDFPDYGSTFYLDAAKSEGLLKSRTDAKQDTAWGEANTITIDTPQGDSAAISALIESAKQVDAANIDYDIAPNLFRGQGENSNSFATSILKNAGLSLPEGTSYQDLGSKGKIATGLGRTFEVKDYSKDTSKDMSNSQSLNIKSSLSDQRTKGSKTSWLSSSKMWGKSKKT